MLESKIQAHTIKVYQADGWIVNKILQCTNNGWPDLELYRNGITLFIECKAPGESIRPLQLYRHQQLRSAGFTVLVIDYLI